MTPITRFGFGGGLGVDDADADGLSELDGLRELEGLRLALTEADGL
jgi:hypothetical protein